MAWAKHAMCKSALLRARADALTKSKAHLEAQAAHVSDDDLDAPLSDAALKSIWDNFRTTNGGLVLPPRSRPSNQLVSRLYRELLKYVFSMHPITRALNVYQTSVNPPSTQRKAILGHVQVSTGHKALPEADLEGRIDCMLRLDLLYWAYLVIGSPKDHTDAMGRTTKWFTLTAMYDHLDYLKTKLYNGSISSLPEFLRREMEIRAKAFELVLGESQLSLGNALQTARERGADTWVNLYRNAEGQGALTPLYKNPLVSLAADGTKRQRLNSSNSGVTSSAFPIKHGNTATTETPRHKAICLDYSSGVGCTNASGNCPNGLHICDPKLRKKNNQFCGGRHHRGDCPGNQ